MLRYTDIHPKVAAGGLGGALSVIVVYLLSTFAHVSVTPEVAAAIATLFTFAAGYFTTGDAGANLPAPPTPPKP